MAQSAERGEPRGMAQLAVGTKRLREEVGVDTMAAVRLGAAEGDEDATAPAGDCDRLAGGGAQLAADDEEGEEDSEMDEYDEREAELGAAAASLFGGGRGFALNGGGGKEGEHFPSGEFDEDEEGEEGDLAIEGEDEEDEEEDGSDEESDEDSDDDEDDSDVEGKAEAADFLFGSLLEKSQKLAPAGAMRKANKKEDPEEAMRKGKGSRLDDEESGGDSDDESSEVPMPEDLDDINKVDNQLGALVRLKQEQLSAGRERAQQLAHFKLRALDLVECFVRHAAGLAAAAAQATSSGSGKKSAAKEFSAEVVAAAKAATECADLSVNLVEQLLEAAARAAAAPDQAAVVQRTAKLLRSRPLQRALAPPPSGAHGSLNADAALGALKRVLGFASRGARDGFMVGLAADAVCAILRSLVGAKLLVAAPAKGGKAGESTRVTTAAIELLGEAVAQYASVKSCKLTSSFWKTLAARQPTVCWQLMPAFCAGIDNARSAYLRADISSHAAALAKQAPAISGGDAALAATEIGRLQASTVKSLIAAINGTEQAAEEVGKKAKANEAGRVKRVLPLLETLLVVAQAAERLVKASPPASLDVQPALDAIASLAVADGATAQGGNNKVNAACARIERAAAAAVGAVGDAGAKGADAPGKKAEQKLGKAPKPDKADKKAQKAAEAASGDQKMRTKPAGGKAKAVEA
mmetsp:Transcript_46047/g.106216  ORF Transcript_46047/g.106216 Transcript_46047/m.106216 type:complete len:694 (-) Transcript_46047:230-2311(-)